MPLPKAYEPSPSEDKPGDGAVPAKPLCGLSLQSEGQTPPAPRGTLLCVKTGSAPTSRACALLFVPEVRAGCRAISLRPDVCESLLVTEMQSLSRAGGRCGAGLQGRTRPRACGAPAAPTGGAAALRSAAVSLGRWACGGSDAFPSFTGAAECPDRSPGLQPWSPGHDPDHRVSIGQGRALLLTSSATVHSVRISDGGEPVPPPPSPPRALLRGPETRSWVSVPGFGSPTEPLLPETAVGSEPSGGACLRAERGEGSLRRAQSSP